jgi:hypothetical protein
MDQCAVRLQGTGPPSLGTVGCGLGAPLCLLVPHAAQIPADHKLLGLLMWQAIILVGSESPRRLRGVSVSPSS